MLTTAYVVDTSAWIEWLIASPQGKQIDKALPAREQIIVPTMVQLELSKWLVRELGDNKADQVLAYTQKCQVIAMDTDLALLAADMHREYRLATADAIVYATAHQQKAGLLTCDAHFERLPHVSYFSKKAQ